MPKKRIAKQLATEPELRLVARWVATCAARALPIFEVAAPSDARPRDAIEGIRAFARGGKRTAKLRSLALDALRAAREVDDMAAPEAARAAGYAASSAFTHALISKDQIKHILGPVVYAARARELDRVNTPTVGDKEIQWALQRATPTIRTIVRRLPRRRKGRTRLDQLYYQLDAALRR